MFCSCYRGTSLIASLHAITTHGTTNYWRAVSGERQNRCAGPLRGVIRHDGLGGHSAARFRRRGHPQPTSLATQASGERGPVSHTVLARSEHAGGGYIERRSGGGTGRRSRSRCIMRPCMPWRSCQRRSVCESWGASEFRRVLRTAWKAFHCRRRLWSGPRGLAAKMRVIHLSAFSGWAWAFMTRTWTKWGL